MIHLDFLTDVYTPPAPRSHPKNPTGMMLKKRGSEGNFMVSKNRISGLDYTLLT